MGQDDLTFGEVKKKLHLSLLEGDEPDVLKYITILRQKSEEPEHYDFVNSVLECLASGEMDELEELFE